MANKNRSNSKQNKANSRKGMRFLFVMALGILGLFFLPIIKSPKSRLKILPNADWKQVKEYIHSQDLLRFPLLFEWAAELTGYPQHIHPGSYAVDNWMGTLPLLKVLFSGRQETISLVVNKYRTEHEFFVFIAQKLATDTLALKQLLSDSAYLSKYQLSPNNSFCLITPNTYEVYWSCSAQKLLDKMGKAYLQFWNEERKKAAVGLGFSIPEIINIAAIVEEESNYVPEKSMIASVYINRLRKGIPLQADPTIKYALGNFTLKRITQEHLTTASPFNTYLHTGLPPTPICTPSVSSIEAVLHASNSNKLFFCADPNLNGHHIFAQTLGEHEKNAKNYHDALNKKGIH
jgi:UPF0755 protein